MHDLLSEGIALVECLDSPREARDRCSDRFGPLGHGPYGNYNKGKRMEK